MALVLKQSTAVDVLIGPFVDLTDGATAETGESPSVKLSKNGQTLGAKNDATAPAHDADGYYNCELDATDTNTVGTLVLTVAASANALPVRHEFLVVEEATYDFLYASGATPIADINAECDTALTDYDAVVPADLPTNFADLTISASTGLVTVGGTAIGAITANSLDASAGAEIADAVLDELLSEHTDAGSLGKALADVETDVTAILVDTAEIANLNDISAADVNAQVLDVLNTDTFAEPTGVPPATDTLANKIGRLHMALRNQITITATKKTFYDDAGNAEWEQDLSDDGTTFTQTEANAI